MTAIKDELFLKKKLKEGNEYLRSSWNTQIHSKYQDTYGWKKKTCISILENLRLIDRTFCGCFVKRRKNELKFMVLGLKRVKMKGIIKEEEIKKEEKEW